MNNNLPEGIGVSFSKDLLDYLQDAFSIHFERGFLLFEKNGIIQKTVESTSENRPSSFSFNTERMLEAISLMEEDGFSYAGCYHHHLDSDAAIKHKLQNHLKEHPTYNPDQLSPADRGVFSSIGLNGSRWNDPEVIKAKEKIKYMFLGHKSESIPFHVNTYSVVSRNVLKNLPENHFLNILKNDKNTTPFYQNHYMFDDIIQHPSSIYVLANSTVDAQPFLREKGALFDIEIVDLGDEKLKLYTEKNTVFMAEVYTDASVDRLRFENEILKSKYTFGDNTNWVIKPEFTFIEKNDLPKEQERFENKYGSVIKQYLANKN